MNRQRKISFVEMLLILIFVSGALVYGAEASRNVVRFSCAEGEFDVELYLEETPKTAENFLKYVDSERYNNSFIHRSVRGFVIQGGGYRLNGTNLLKIATDPPVINEPSISNLRGTLAMAKLGDNPNSATSEWFVNLGDNSANLDFQNGGFTAFGHVVGNGMQIVDQMASFTIYNATAQLGSPFGELPLKAPALTKDSLLLFSKVQALREGTVVVDFDFSSDNQGFTGGFADLPANFDPALYELVADHRALPSGLGRGKGLFLSGANSSDDLWMYWKKKITGLKPNASYEISMDLELCSSESAGMVGAGGAPAESVYLKVGASAVEPSAVADSEGCLRLNIDKGNQSHGGIAAQLVGNISKESDAGAGYARIFRNNRSSRLAARSAADGSLWLFFGTDSGYEGKTSLYYTRFTAVMEPLDATQALQAVQGTFVGNYASGSMLGQLSIRLAKGGVFTGTLTRASGSSVLRGKFDANGTATISIPALGSLQLSFQSMGLGDGQWNSEDAVYLTGILNAGGASVDIECRAASRSGGPLAPLLGSRINTLLESLGKSGLDFGYGISGASVGKDGMVIFAGALADGTKLAGSARLVEDGSGGWKLPVALPLSSVKGFLHGEAAVVSSPQEGGFHLESSAPWTWSRPANPKAKSFAAGFEEELEVKGRVWNWTKGTSVLGGAGGNFTLTLSAPSGFVPASGAEILSGSLGADNKTAWRAVLPKGFAMQLTPASGLISGKFPGLQNGKPATLSFQGFLFPIDMKLDSGSTVRGSGFISGSGGSGKVEIVVP